MSASLRLLTYAVGLGVIFVMAYLAGQLLGPPNL